jgi:TnsA endonuclease N terminal
MPVRKVSNRGGNVVGRFPSMKMGRMIAFESLLERDFIYLLDYDIRVEWFEEQPLTIEYLHDDQALHYTPDFHLVEAGRPVLVECKPEHFVDTEDNQRKFAVAREWCASHGWEFRVVTDCQVRAGFRLHNVKRLTQYARLVIDPALSRRIDELLHEASTPFTLQTLAQAIGPDDPDRVTASLLHLAFHHHLDVPLDLAPLSGQTLVMHQLPACQAVKS